MRLADQELCKRLNGDICSFNIDVKCLEPKHQFWFSACWDESYSKEIYMMGLHVEAVTFLFNS